MQRVPTIAGTSIERLDVDGLVRLTVKIGSQSTPESSRLLTSDVFQVVSFLAEAESFELDRAVLIDVQVPTLADPAMRAESAAFLAACKALVHAWVREQQGRTCTVNMLISLVTQEESRTRSLEYFADECGRFSHGSVIDLRETA